MIHVRTAKENNLPDGKIIEFNMTLTEESITNFFTLVNRALNCWDTAPVELKELGDMITHGRITQEHQ